MATDPDTIALSARRAVRARDAVMPRKMFGEYALYCDGKVVALVCDDSCS